VEEALLANKGEILPWMTCAIGYNRALEIWQKLGFCHLAMSKHYEEQI